MNHYYYSQNLNYSQALSQQGVAVSPRPRGLYFTARRYGCRARVYVLENWKRVWVLALWLSVMAGLFSWKFFQYKQRASVFDVMGYCVSTAKGAAETLKLNMALILLPVCRNTITWLRNTKLGTVVPFDDNLNFHKASI